MKTHQLKTWPKYFDAVARGEKRFEVRRDDRDFEVGDIVTLQRFDPKKNAFTGAEMNFQIGYILRGSVFGIEAGHCVFGLQDLEPS
jgi:hypothetical protein